MEIMEFLQLTATEYIIIKMAKSLFELPKKLRLTVTRFILIGGRCFFFPF